ncbi:hypothetical protein JTB14_023663 [Gonioctena quinquepunctata]|nr:hypothetical protein JTB14_023663 [Gonioctena quinquepunctata]
MKSVFIFIIISNNFLQSEESCDNILVSDFSQTDCITKSTSLNTFFYWLDEKKSCVPNCQQYKLEGYFKQKCPCPPGYKCGKKCSGNAEDSEVDCEVRDDCADSSIGIRSRCADMCIPDSDSCMVYHARTVDYKDNKFKALKFKPACDNVGKWKAKQCKGGASGRCYCYDAIGTRLFGQAIYAESEDMTCACSRRKAELESQGRYYVALHCDSMGNYEKLQCDSGLCWCAEPKTGALTTPVVPEKAMKKLPCYDVTKVGGQYLRQCDSVAYAMATIKNTMTVHGVTYNNLGTKLCDGDGAFGAYNISEGIAYCTWRDGHSIGTWQSNAGQYINQLNCNCARDFKMYSNVLTCSGNGNYLPVQSIIKDGVNQYFCVDNEGFAKSNFFSSSTKDCTLYY